MPVETPVEFEKWLREQTPEIRSLVLARLALRVYPIVNTHGPTKNVLALPAARAALTAIVAAHVSTAEITTAARAACAAAITATERFDLDEIPLAHNSVYAAAIAACAAGGDAELAVKYAKDFEFALYAAIDDTEPVFSALYFSPLWEPKNRHSVSASKIEFPNEGSAWRFWREWYQGFLDGKPLDWELQRRVALIEEAIWEAGPEAVAEEIERIRAHYALELEIAKLKEHFRSVATSDTPAHRLHNQPPEAIEGEMQAVRREITLVWNKIEELEVEIVKPDPSPSKLNKIAQSLWDISIRIGKYCGGKVDKALDELAKVIGKTGTQAAIAYLTATTAAQNDSVKSVAKAIWEFAKTLPPG